MVITLPDVIMFDQDRVTKVQQMIDSIQTNTPTRRHIALRNKTSKQSALCAVANPSRNELFNILFYMFVG